MSLPDDPRLAETLAHLADDASAQERYLRKIGTWPSLDELALELDDVTGSDVVAEAAGPLLQRLSETLDEMSGAGNARLWEPDALHNPEWDEVRRLARDALTALTGHA